MPSYLVAILLLFRCLLGTNGGSVGLGGSCSTDHDHLDPATHKFMSECTDQTCCSGVKNGSCLARECRRDEFPFGYVGNESPPPQCSWGTFCPDDGSGCKPYASVGQGCEMNRDEQCAPPPNWKFLGGQQNFNGSICLRSQCMYVFASTCQYLVYSVMSCQSLHGD